MRYRPHPSAVHPFLSRKATRQSLFIIIVVALGLSACTIPTGSTPPLSGHLLVVGSTALQPLVTTAAKLFMKENPQATITVRGGGSITGLRAVTGQKSNIGDSDVYADPAIYPDPNLTDHIVCVIPFTMIVNPDVKNITSLTHQQLIDIYSTRTIRNWKAVGGPDLPIVPVVRPNTSGTRATFRKYVLGGGDESGTLLRTDSSQTVRDTVAHTPGAIGYLALSVLDGSVRALGIDGTSATAHDIEAGSYPFWGYEHMYTLGDDTPLLSAFLAFMLTPAIQQEAQRESYIPISVMKLPAVGISTGNTIPDTHSILVNTESEVTGDANV